MPTNMSPDELATLRIVMAPFVDEMSAETKKMCDKAGKDFADKMFGLAIAIAQEGFMAGWKFHQQTGINRTDLPKGSP